MMSKFKIVVCILIILSLSGAICTAVLFFFNIPNDVNAILSTWAGIIGTLASVCLSVVAMIYSDKSSKAAEASLETITKHYERFYESIRDEKITKNIGVSGIEKIIEETSKK